MREPYSVRNHLVNSPPRAPESHHLLGLGIVGQIVNHLGELLIYRFERGATRKRSTRARGRRKGGLRVVAMVVFFFFLCSKGPLRRRDGRSFKNCLRSLALAGSLGDLLGPLGADKRISCDLTDKLVSNNVAMRLCL